MNNVSDWEMTNEHLGKIGNIMSKQSFWKAALFCVMCAERQWQVYKKLAVGREWDDTKTLDKVLNRFWQAIPTGYGIGEKYLSMIEECTIVCKEDWDALAAMFLESLMQLFEIFEEKDKEAAKDMAECNFNFLDAYMDLEINGYDEKHVLVTDEMEFQKQLVLMLCRIENAEKKKCIEDCREKEVCSILKDNWFKDYPDYMPVKKKSNLLKKNTILFRTRHQENILRDKDIQLCYKTVKEYFQSLQGFDLQKLKESEPKTFDKRNYDRTRDEMVKASMRATQEKDVEAVQRIRGKHIELLHKDFIRFYDGLKGRYNILAEIAYLCDEPMNKVMENLYLQAQCCIIAYRLFQNGYPADDYMYENYKRNNGYALEGAWQAAFIYEYKLMSSIIENNGVISNYYNPKIYIMYMLLGKYEEADKVLILYEPDPHNPFAEKEYKLCCALNIKDSEEIYKCTISLIKLIRSMEDLYRTIFAYVPILVLRCAKKMGLKVRRIELSEMPVIFIDLENPNDKENWKVFGMEVVSEYL